MSQNRNVKGSEEVRVSKLGENEINKGKVNNSGGKNVRDGELSNTSVNSGMDSEKNEKSKECGKSYDAHPVSEPTTSNNKVTTSSDNHDFVEANDNTTNEVNNKQSSYAQKLFENTKEIGNQLFFVSTVVNEKGDEVVIFDDDRSGRPIMMDKMTTERCANGSGRLGYARVLVEVDASKEYANRVEISYVDNQMKVKKTKWVNVDCSLKPDRCCYCKVFGHSMNHCKSKQKEVAEEEGVKKQVEGDAGIKNGFNDVRNRKYRGDKNGGGNNAHGNKQANWKVNNSEKYVYKPKENNPKVVSTEKNVNIEQSQGDTSQVKSDGLSKKEVNKSMNSSTSEVLSSLERVWKVSNENLTELKRSANKYNVVNQMDDQEEILENVNRNVSDEEYVYEGRNKAINNLIANEILVNDSGQFVNNIQQWISK
ncbi:hypothetical protein CTI12_AA144780 [Artemisia annua]|uniref:ATPase, F1/V1/A1 complex, alpha/beta subunit, Zinc knuckle CX2CX4HX4C n=1 Tax=Artemisia annua TaxID=35608 RepID=A0A2U1PJU1_ARTAN|nr:hypothetical protein CTI12_AA144780 [Artemisia annua]